jgi:oligopeptide/dipeptide ABC transporter ATP-binding protein
MNASAAHSDASPAAVAERPLVVAEEVTRHFRMSDHVVRAVDGVSLEMPAGETFGLVGESGSGKSTLARLLLRLDQPTSGRILFEGQDLVALSGDDLRRLRREMQSVFQDPYAALNRRKTVEQIVALPLQVHEQTLGRAERRVRVAELLQLVGLRPEHANAYPRQLSGGQCQRVSIARALALGPKFVVLDEAVSAVDVSIQAQILNLLRDLQQQLGLTYLFVTHDLSVVRYMASTVAVMYLGRVVEIGSRDSLFESPQHPYTHALLASIPSVERRRSHVASKLVVREALATDAGAISGCRFHPRCPLGGREVCRTVDPPLRETEQGHLAACHFPQSAEGLLAAASRSRHE